jgi:PAS domain S-box-containing protein
MVTVEPTASVPHTSGPPGPTSTAFLRLQQELATSQSLFKAVFQSARDAILLADDEGRYIEANPAALELLGFKRDELLSKRLWDIIPMGSEENARSLWTDFLNAGQQEGDFALARADGATIQIEFRAVARIVPGVHLSIFRDVTERRFREQRTRLLAEAGALLGEGLDYKTVLTRVAHLATPAFADWCVVDILVEEGKIERLEIAHSDPTVESKAREASLRFPIDPARTYGSPNVLRTGRTELLTITDEMLHTSAVSQEHYDLLKRLELTNSIIAPLKAQGRVFGAISFMRCRPRVPFASTDIELSEELARRASWAIDNARLYEGARQEIALREQVEQALTKLNHELEHRIDERTAALQESNSQLEAFCYSVSHDLRAPLRSMQGFSHALVEDHADTLNTEGRDFARRILAAAEHMDGLLADVLAYSRLSRQQFEPEPVEVASVIEDVLVQLIGETRRRNAGIHKENVRCEVKGNRSALELMLLNLLENALKFVPNGVAPIITISTEERGDRCRICVRDNGIGIPREHQQRIFRIFERLHGIESYPGTGIGLALVQKAAERMNGHVGVESTPGQGSLFWIDLPAAKNPTQKQ